MKTLSFKKLGVAFALIVGAGTVTPVFATSTGGQFLGFNATATDVWTYKCPVTHPRTRARVFDTAVILNFQPMLKVRVGAGLERIDNNPNPFPFVTRGEGGAPSDWSIDLAGVGDNAMMIRKTAAGNDSYTAEAQCFNLFGFVFNPVLTRQINE